MIFATYRFNVKPEKVKVMKTNNEKLEMKERGPVWKPDICIRSGISEKTIRVFRTSKSWKMSIILN